MQLETGCSGWSYRWWKDQFYPPEVKSTDWLTYYARTLSSVEINNSFYRMPTDAMVQGWLRKTPPHFHFSLKAWRVITHIKRLKDCESELVEFSSLVKRFGNRACAVAFQLPPNLSYDAALLKDFLAMLAIDVPCAIEFRHESWFNDTTYGLLKEHNVALCESHLRQWLMPRVTTASFAYVRFHGMTGLYIGAYGKEFLQEFLQSLKQRKLNAAYVYFNNTDRDMHAITDAVMLKQLAAKQPVAA